MKKNVKVHFYSLILSSRLNTFITRFLSGINALIFAQNVINYIQRVRLKPFSTSLNTYLKGYKV